MCLCSISHAKQVISLGQNMANKPITKADKLHQIYCLSPKTFIAAMSNKVVSGIKWKLTPHTFYEKS